MSQKDEIFESEGVLAIGIKGNHCKSHLNIEKTNTSQLATMIAQLELMKSIILKNYEKLMKNG